MKRCWVLLNHDRFCSLQHQSLPPTVLTNSLSAFAHVGSYLNLFIPRGSNQWNCTHISASLPSISYHIFMGFCFCISASDWADILLRFFQIHSDIPSDLFQSCFASSHSGWTPGNVCLAQCPTAAAKSSNTGLCVTDLINVSATSLKTFFFSFPVIFLPSDFL